MEIKLHRHEKNRDLHEWERLGKCGQIPVEEGENFYIYYILGRYFIKGYSLGNEL